MDSDSPAPIDKPYLQGDLEKGLNTTGFIKKGQLHNKALRHRLKLYV